ncbi:rhodanese-like domain-containing protein [Actinomycetospora sp. C-140]
MSAVDTLLARARERLARLGPSEAAAAVDDGALLVDIRPGWQRLDEGTVPGALVIERNHLEWRLDPTCEARIAEATDHDRRWIVLCSEGYTSSLAAAALQEIGLHRATDVVGGFRAWAAVGLPTAPGSDAPPDYAVSARGH